jgi:hypothetical protein
MQNWVLKLEESIRYQDLNDLAEDAVQGIALIAWIVMLATL